MKLTFLIYSARIEHNARFLIINLPRLTVHTEPIIIPKEKDWKENPNTMPGQEGKRWENNLQLSTMIRAIQTKNERNAIQISDH